MFGSNRDVINEYIAAAREKRRVPLLVKNEILQIIPEPLMINDLSSLRHCEHIAASGICGCSRERALRVVPTKPRDIKEMHKMIRENCSSPTLLQRVRWSHNPPKGKSLPDPCELCGFGTDRSKVDAEYKELLQTEAQLASVQTKAGKAKFSKWRMAHACLHNNIPDNCCINGSK